MYALRFLMFWIRPIVWLMGLLLKPIGHRFSKDNEYAVSHHRVTVILQNFIEVVDALNALHAALMMNADFEFWLNHLVKADRRAAAVKWDESLRRQVEQTFAPKDAVQQLLEMLSQAGFEADVSVMADSEELARAALSSIGLNPDEADIITPDDDEDDEDGDWGDDDDPEPPVDDDGGLIRPIMFQPSIN